MKENDNVTMIEKKCIYYGLLTAGALVAYFLLMRLVGLAENVELRFLNLVILMTGIMLAHRSLKKAWKGPLGYLQGLSCGTFTSLVAVTSFTLFTFVYLMFLDPAFMASLKAEYGSTLNPYTSALAVFMEGAFSGMIVSFCMMQYLKDSLLPYLREEGTLNPVIIAVRPVI